MRSSSWLFTYDKPAQRAVTDLTKTHAERLAMEQLARAEQRHLDLAEQRSEHNSPEVRIRTWEKLHGLRLPSDPTHPILDVVAVGTRLTLADVLEEQRARTSRNAVSA